MAHILAQVIMEADTLLPEDRTINTFHFDGPATDLIADQLEDELVAFYNANPGAGDPICIFLSPHLSRAANVNTIKFYDVSAGPGGTPYFEAPWTLDPGFVGAGPIPEEVALCLSYQGLPIPGGNQRRRRGRVYIGPLNTATQGAVDDISRPTGALMDSLLDAGQALHGAAIGLGVNWCVYSRVDDALVDIEQLWCDNAWDTQRRRGRDATSREVRTL